MAVTLPKKNESIGTAADNFGLQDIEFTVDAALFRELGERLVGKPHIALAELIKNSYDADATRVVIRFTRDTIEITDDGVGMNFLDFRNFWMRIGAPHKQKEQVSRIFKRPLTGSKGVGRLAVQFMASRLDVYTASSDNKGNELVAHVDWDKAVTAPELTKAVARYKMQPASRLLKGSNTGTALVLSGLKQQWSADSFTELAKEVWPLQPPFRPNPKLDTDKQKAFDVTIDTPYKSISDAFNSQMKAALDNYYCRILGRLSKIDGVQTVNLQVDFRDGNKLPTTYPLNGNGLHELDFDIRVFYLAGKQPHGVLVETAREYMMEHGGVHVYDAGFHLPYYGRSTDWLSLELDHARRVIKSKLLPETLQDAGSEGLRYLPSNNRVFGVVHVNTSRERSLTESLPVSAREQALTISVTRDRLVDNDAYDSLVKAVRYALDFYAVNEARRKAERSKASAPIEPIESVTAKVRRIDQVLEEHRDVIPSEALDDLRVSIEEAVKARSAEAEAVAGRVGLLGALATAGISALAYEHEVSKQFHLIGSVAKQLRRVDVGAEGAKANLDKLANRLDSALESARASRALFAHLMDSENRENRQRFKARTILEQVRDQMGILLRGISVETFMIDSTLVLPEAGYAEWSAIYQNVLLNAVNAMLDSPSKRISIQSGSEGRKRAIIVQDTGHGVAPATSEELFKPFVRKSKISAERRELGLGGTGLGLAIVRMIAESIDCEVSFVRPASGFKTAFELSWNERK